MTYIDQHENIDLIIQNTDMELYDAEEAMGIRKILAHEVRVKKNP